MAGKGIQLNLDELKLQIQPAGQEKKGWFVKNDGEWVFFPW